MRTSSFDKSTIVQIMLLGAVLPLAGCDLLPKPCAPDLLNTPENQAANAFRCTCTPELKADPEHLCCTTAGTCSEDSGFPDPETSDPVGNLSLALNDLRTLPLEPLQEVCDDALADVEVAWEYINQTNGDVGNWEDYVVIEPVLSVSIVGVGVAKTAQAGWSPISASTYEAHSEDFELAPEYYAASISGLPLGVQNRDAVTSRNITKLQEGDSRYKSVCGSGGAGG